MREVEANLNSELVNLKNAFNDLRYSNDDHVRMLNEKDEVIQKLHSDMDAK
jgi:hypothetical protein